MEITPGAWRGPGTHANWSVLSDGGRLRWMEAAWAVLAPSGLTGRRKVARHE